MLIQGLEKTTLIDYPNNIAATIFLGKCNFRCLFCYNKNLVLSYKKEPIIPINKIINFLQKRKNILDGVCISGGEPTINDNIFYLIDKIKQLGYKIKLDTNGSNPIILEKLIDEKMIDMVAMDIKSSKKSYYKIVNSNSFDLKLICKSVDIIMSKNIKYEFRTTVVKELHNINDFYEIGKWLSECNIYYLQSYKNLDNIVKKKFNSYSIKELNNFRNILLKTIKHVYIR